VDDLPLRVWCVSNCCLLRAHSALLRRSIFAPPHPSPPPSTDGRKPKPKPDGSDDEDEEEEDEDMDEEEDEEEDEDEDEDEDMDVDEGDDEDTNDDEQERVPFGLLTARLLEGESVVVDLNEGVSQDRMFFGPKELVPPGQRGQPVPGFNGACL